MGQREEQRFGALWMGHSRSRDLPAHPGVVPGEQLSPFNSNELRTFNSMVLLFLESTETQGLTRSLQLPVFDNGKSCHSNQDQASKRAQHQGQSVGAVAFIRAGTEGERCH